MSYAAAGVAPMRSARSDCHRRGRDGVRDGADEHDADLVRCDAGLRDRLERRGLGQVDGLDVGTGALARDDAGALADPLVGGVDRADQVVVRHGLLAARGAEGQDAAELVAAALRQHGAARAGRVGLEARGPVVGGACVRHAVTSVFSAPWALCSSSIAAGRSSGDLIATVGVPRRPRFASPTSAPAGASSMIPVTSACWNDVHHGVPVHGAGDLAHHQVDEPATVVDA